MSCMPYKTKENTCSQKEREGNATIDTLEHHSRTTVEARQVETAQSWSRSSRLNQTSLRCHR